MPSHLLQMRGLKRSCNDTVTVTNLSHLLQMRGLKHERTKLCQSIKSSHLLQMRGLKPKLRDGKEYQCSRIFYRCVD